MILKGIGFLVGALFALQAGAADPPALKTRQEMVSYSIGVEIARGIRQRQVELDAEMLIQGLKDALAGERLLLREEELRRQLTGFRSDLPRNPVDRKALAEQNRRLGARFLAANSAREGVVSLPSGIQYRVLKPGKGPKPRDTDRVACNYRGMRLDGSEFDATAPGRPATLEVARLIPGWREALQLMSTGATWQIVVPPELAYREQGVGDQIGPNETLLFELELVAIK